MIPSQETDSLLTSSLKNYYNRDVLAFMLPIPENGTNNYFLSSAHTYKHGKSLNSTASQTSEVHRLVLVAPHLRVCLIFCFVLFFVLFWFVFSKHEFVSSLVVWTE